MELRVLSVAIAPGLGCASADAVPYCAAIDEGRAATPACYAEPEVIRMAQDLAGLIDPKAGPFLIQVEFDAIGGVASMCAQRSPYENPFSPRKRLAERTGEIQAVARSEIWTVPRAS